MVGPQAEAADVLGRWAELREITESGAILIRPDHHIGWRSAVLGGTAEADLDAALRQILARDQAPADVAGTDARSAS